MVFTTFKQLKTAMKFAAKYANEKAKELIPDDSAISPLQKIIGLVIAIIMGASLIPTAVSSINAANTTSWSAEQIALWGIVGIIVIIAFVTIVINITDN